MRFAETVMYYVLIQVINIFNAVSKNVMGLPIG